MPAPRHVFLDTSVFDSQSYNFASQAFLALIEASKGAPLTLLVPAPIEAEIQRHISDSASQAVKALEDARRKAPFLTKWDQWPLRKKETPALKDHLLELARSEYVLFKRNFTVVHLDYSQIDVGQIMSWYERGRSPFGPGKRKEFPDAIALYSLLSYARSQHVHVGILSSDHDFRDACAFHNELLYFSSVAALTEALLGEASRVALLRTALEHHSQPLLETISANFGLLSFFPTEDHSGEVSDVDVKEVALRELNAINLGELEATIAFDATVMYSAHISFDDPEAVWHEEYPPPWYSSHRRAGTVVAHAKISGTAKVALNEDWTTVARVVQLTIDTDDIGVDGFPDVEAADFD